MVFNLHIFQLYCTYLPAWCAIAQWSPHSMQNFSRALSQKLGIGSKGVQESASHPLSAQKVSWMSSDPQ